MSMRRFAAAAVLCGFLAVLCPAQDPKSQTKWEPPTPPVGWKAIVSKDATYQFAFPDEPPKSGTRNRDYTIHGTRVRLQVNYCRLKDNTLLEVETAILAGAGLNGTTVGDVFEAIVGAERDDGFEVSAPKIVTVGKDIKAREYRLTKDNLVRRMILFFAKPRLFALNVTAEDNSRLDAETANIFLKSLTLVPPQVLAARARERAAQLERYGKENLKKYGATWSADLKDMTPPDALVVGVIRGKEFKPNKVTLYPGGRLVFRQGGTDAFADVQVELLFLARHGESIVNKTYEIAAAARNPAGSPHIRLATMEGDRFPKSEAFVSRYSLKLKFGAEDADGDIPGTIYLCMPDSGKSFLAGAFLVKEK